MIREAKQESDFQEIADLAREIWMEHYEPIIGEEQVSYMLNAMQSGQAIREQVESGFRYFILRCFDTPAGYLAVKPDEDETSMMISKLYVLKRVRGAGCGTELLGAAETCPGLSRLWLTVNRNNVDSIAWYERRGFVKTREVIQEIGEGFVMDDFVMEKVLTA